MRLDHLSYAAGPEGLGATAQREAKQAASRRPFVRRGLSTLDLALFTRQLATLLRSGLPLEESLRRGEEFHRRLDERRSVRWFSPDPVPQRAIELAVISWIRHHYMDTPLLRATFQVVVGGVLVFIAGILIGSS